MIYSINENNDNILQEVDSILLVENYLLKMSLEEGYKGDKSSTTKEWLKLLMNKFKSTDNKLEDINKRITAGEKAIKKIDAEIKRFKTLPATQREKMNKAQFAKVTIGCFVPFIGPFYQIITMNLC